MCVALVSNPGGGSGFEPKVSPTYLSIVPARARKHKLLRAQSLEIARAYNQLKHHWKFCVSHFPCSCSTFSFHHVYTSCKYQNMKIKAAVGLAACSIIQSHHVLCGCHKLMYSLIVYSNNYYEYYYVTCRMPPTLAPCILENRMLIETVWRFQLVCKVVDYHKEVDKFGAV